MKDSCFEEISNGNDSLFKPGKSIVSQKVSIYENTTPMTIFINLASCTIQTVLGYICLDIMLAICLHYVQKSYPDPNAANGVGLAYTIVNVVIIPMGLGFNQSLNVHVAQALGNKKQLLSRRYLNLTFYSHIIYFVPVCIIIYFLKVPFSKTIAEDPMETADYAWEFLIPLMISSIFAIEFECFKTYMIACKVFTPFIAIHVITTSLLLLWCYLLIDVADLGIIGAGLGMIITEVLNCILLGLYLLFTKDKEHFSGFTFNIIIFKKQRLYLSYLKSSLAMIVHVYADFFVFFLLTFLAMGLGKVKLNAQIAFSNTSALYFRMPISLSLALLTFIGEEMGRLNVINAKRYAQAGMFLFTLFLAIVILIIWVFRGAWASFYSGDKADVEEEMLDTLPYFLLGCLILDGSQGSLTGILKGINKATFVTYSTLISYYVCGIPVICAFTFSWGLDWGVTGIWLGFGLANAILLVMYVVLIFTTDWDEQAQNIKVKIDLQNKLQASSIAQALVEDADEPLDKQYSKY